MKIVKIIVVIAIILGLSFVGYRGYLAYQKWQADRFSEINMLKTNQDLFLKKVTALSETITHIVNDIAKTTTTVVKPDNTYEALKAEVIELKKNEDANKDEINSLKEKLSEQRQAFLNSDNTVLIKKDGENILLYRDTEGTLQPASEGIEKIIEHKDVSTMYTPIEEKIEEKKYVLKAGAYYSWDKTYGVILSKDIINIKNYSLNASLLLSDYKDIKFAVGADIGYKLKDNLELGVGYSTNKDYYIKLQYSF